MMKAEENFVTQQPRPMGIWIDFFETELISSLPIKYFDDPEEAKTWLVSEFD